ncbi:lysoplasmalogenase [Lysobacter terrae]
MVTQTLSASRGSEGRWIAAVVTAAVLAIAGAMVPELRWLHYACKPLATVLIAAMVWCAPTGGRYRTAVLVGLLLSALGDVFLMLEPAPGGPDWFVFGLASFLFAHVAYLVGLCSRAKLLAKVWPYVLYAVIALAISSVLWPHLPAALKAPVGVYVLLLSVMAAQSAVVWSCLRDRSGAAAALGGAFFVASDATLAIDRFVAPFPGAVVIVLATYWSAQLLIGLSVRRL